ncbi:MAG: DUF3147 family protein [Burkholderiaceae bacterium]|nr:MAG: DUF3147 family protein [Burkholderiaceae bacterium]
MTYTFFKIAVTTVLVVTISEIAKRSSFAAAVLASIPLVSVLALLWLYIDTHDVERISALSSSIFWLVLPSLALFIALPLLLKSGLHFYLSLLLSLALTAACYAAMVWALGRYGIKL